MKTIDIFSKYLIESTKYVELQADVTAKSVHKVQFEPCLAGLIKLVLAGLHKMFLLQKARHSLLLSRHKYLKTPKPIWIGFVMK
jgi:hypothetical protein